ncbi:NAD(P)-binding protein [Suhomyces tanzawaensis NRRL Y-17324]|uniref:NAD(P)-binding protein n=1 Tax=Suhomyces tanzawaensis NRRL Y-17324 TaxID=984487 RepID=A0A1E4SDZ9_9ASCO|nr:NAD(P)-binding protein [Suhomyces tanzawaensis NRRL Y-17324]ODV77737.1 NAD(P)-binding protein [Suhomyces tanzawaensis NRRL Y-17324]
MVLSIDSLLQQVIRALWLTLAVNVLIILYTRQWIHTIPGAVILAAWLVYYANRRYKLPRDWSKLGGDDIALVTGGSNGLGKKIVELLLERNVEVYVLDVVEPSYSHSRATYIRCDLSSEGQTTSSISSLVKSLASSKRHISVLVNNAGIRHNRSLLELESDEVHRLFNINTLSHIWTLKLVVNNHIQHVLPATPKAQLYIVSISSILGVLAPRNLSLYSATKAANILIYEALTQELVAFKSIRILQVLPGQLTTDMFKDVAPSRQFLAPLVNHVKLAHQILARIETGEMGVLCEPLYSNFLPAVRALPLAVQKVCRWFSQMDEKVS